MLCVPDRFTFLDACSAPDPEALLEALLAKKLTSSMVMEAGKGMAQKWVKDKTTPKESLLAAFGAEDHGLVVRHLPVYGLSESVIEFMVHQTRFMLYMVMLHGRHKLSL